jgi:hypothetical protein
MRRALLFTLALVLLAAAPAGAAKKPKPNTITRVKVSSPAPANASVAGFQLTLKRTGHKKNVRKTALSAAGLPKHVSVYAVVGKQKRSDRVRGVLVIVNRASKVSTSATARTAARKFVVNLKHAAVPKGYRLTVKVTETDNVLSRHRTFVCANYFKTADLASAGKLGGPGLPGITLGTIMQSACHLAKSQQPFPALGEFRYSLNAAAGTLPFVQSPQFPNEIDGNATFNYPVKAFGVLADKGHQFTGCAFAAGTCAISSTPGHVNDYVLFRLTAPAAAGTALPLALATTPNPAPALRFQFYGFDSGNHRSDPLLTSGP